MNTSEFTSEQWSFLGDARRGVISWINERVDNHDLVAHLDDLPADEQEEALDYGYEQAGHDDALLDLFGDDIDSPVALDECREEFLALLSEKTSDLLTALNRQEIPPFHHWSSGQQGYLMDCVRRIMVLIHEDMTTDSLGPVGRLPEDTMSVKDIGEWIGDHPYHLSEQVDEKVVSDLFVPSATEPVRERVVEAFMDEVWKEVNLRLSDPVGVYCLDSGARSAVRLATPAGLRRCAAYLEGINATVEGRLLAMALRGWLYEIAAVKDDDGYLDGEEA
jgi:hypothetical protein